MNFSLSPVRLPVRILPSAATALKKKVAMRVKEEGRRKAYHP